MLSYVQLYNVHKPVFDPILFRTKVLLHIHIFENVNNSIGNTLRMSLWSRSYSCSRYVR